MPPRELYFLQNIIMKKITSILRLLTIVTAISTFISCKKEIEKSQIKSVTSYGSRVNDAVSNDLLMANKAVKSPTKYTGQTTLDDTTGVH